MTKIKLSPENESGFSKAGQRPLNTEKPDAKYILHVDRDTYRESVGQHLGYHKPSMTCTFNVTIARKILL